MGLLKRVSDSVWSYVSPVKPQIKDGQSAPLSEPRHRFVATPPQATSHKQVRQADSASPGENTSARHRDSSLSRGADGSASKRKRKASHNLALSPRRKRRVTETQADGISMVRRNAESDVGYDDADFDEGYEFEDKMRLGSDEDAQAEENETSGDAFAMRHVYLSRSPVYAADDEAEDWGEDEQLDEAEDGDEPEDGEGLEEGFGEGDESLVVTTEEYEFNPSRRRKIAIPASDGPENAALQDDLRNQGWSADHIELYIRLARRGHEPILPHFFKFEFRWMPDILFCENDDDAIINSAHNRLAHARKALEDLFDIGPAMRDALISPNNTPPERLFRKLLNNYIKWAARDSDLRLETAIPLVITQVGSPYTPVPELRMRAERRLAKLALRYREALRVSRSIEVSSAGAASGLSSPSTQLVDEVPTLYAFVCKDTTVVLGGYRPGDEAPTLKSIATFTFDDPDYDIWSAFAMAITVCHCRNVQMRIAEDAGIGASVPGENDDQGDEDEDPDA